MQFTIKTTKQEEVIDITSKVEECIKVKEGIALVYTPHATASIIINENYDPNICLDILEALSNLIPQGKWKHDKIDNNGAAHIKAAILGPSESIPIKDGKLQLGQWQSIMLVELDGPRERTIIVKVK